MKKGSRKPKIPNAIPPTDPKNKIKEKYVNRYILFSFKYLKEDSDFNYHSLDSDYYCSVIDRLRDISKLTTQELFSARGTSLRSHEIIFSETSRKQGFDIRLPSEDDMLTLPYQFTISKERGRIDGFLIANVFFIVWIDSGHNLYS